MIQSNLRQLLRHRFVVSCILAAVIALQLFRMVQTYFSGNNYLCDEVDSYGLANSFYLPAIGQSSFRAAGEIRKSPCMC